MTAESWLYLKWSITMPFMYDPRYCLTCGQPFEPVEWRADVSGIGSDPCSETFVDSDLCQCDLEDNDD